jgi:hypothetical protein
LRKIEQHFPNEVVVVGVHTGKFSSEEETYNVRQAVMRHDIRHPVVNDNKYDTWKAYAVRAWPTIVIVGPDGYVLGSHAGEFDGDRLGDLIQEIVDDCERRGLIDHRPVPLLLEKQKQIDALLSFPGKVLADAGGGRLFVADTDHQRVLQFGLQDLRLQASYGGGEPGLTDGGFERARFNGPQGMALAGDSLYVADSENHAVRRIDLRTGGVATVAGTGEQAQPWPEPGPARQARLNSPWDLLVHGDTLYIAMAGSHQIWALDLAGGRLERFAGDGREALLDGPRLTARLAQPSGLSTDGARLWFADSETSSVRSVDFAAGEVQTHIGLGLFEYGDKEGEREAARLQHPLDVAAAGGLVFVADSYNNRLKVLDPERGLIRRFTGVGEPGFEDGSPDEACFWEPGGLSLAGGTLYVADTNNHSIRSVDLATGEVTTLDLEE